MVRCEQPVGGCPQAVLVTQARKGALMTDSYSTKIPTRVKEITGQRFGRLLVLEYMGLNRHRRALWLCQCDCGREHTTLGVNLCRGQCRSCGCYQRETTYKHGMARRTARAPEYNVWRGMICRCHYPKNYRFSQYGGRGIYVCEAWRKSFIAFFVDMGKRPSAKHSIDRIDNDGPYSPENCRWATAAEQSRNTQRNRLLTLDGVTQTITDWANSLGVDRKTIDGRLRNLGWTMREALTEVAHAQTGPKTMRKKRRRL